MDQELHSIVDTIKNEKINILQFEEIKQQTLNEEKRRKIYFSKIEKNIELMQKQPGVKGIEKIIHNQSQITLHSYEEEDSNSKTASNVPSNETSPVRINGDTQDDDEQYEYNHSLDRYGELKIEENTNSDEEDLERE